MAKSPDLLKPLVLAVVLVAAGGGAYWLEYGKKPRDLQREADAKKILALKNGVITRFEVAGASVKPENAARPPLTVALECASRQEKLCRPDDASKWDLVAPLKTKADDSTVNGLLKNLAGLSATETLDLAAETPEKRAALLKDYGLDATKRAEPRTRRIALFVEGEPHRTVYFGEKHPIGDGVFALLETGNQADETRVFLVSDWQLSVFDQKTSYFRDKNLFGLNEKEISAFTLLVSRKNAGTVEGKRSADEKGWRIRFRASEVDGDVDAIDGILAGVAHLAAKDVAAERASAPEGRAFLAGAKLVYDLKFAAKGAERRMRLYEKKKNAQAVALVYAVVDGQDPIYEVETYAVEKFDRTFAEMRVGKLVSVAERYAITAIDFQGRGQEAFRSRVMKEAGGAWKVGATDTARGKIESILDRLSSKVVIAFSGSPPKGDLLRATFQKSSDGKDVPVAELEFWRDGNHLYARDLRSSKQEIVELAADFAATLPWRAADLTADSAPVRAPAPAHGAEHAHE